MTSRLMHLRMVQEEVGESDILKRQNCARFKCSAVSARQFFARSADVFSKSLNDLLKKKAHAVQKFQDFALCTLHLAHVRPNWQPVPKSRNFALCYSNPGSLPEHSIKCSSRIPET